MTIEQLIDLLKSAQANLQHDGMRDYAIEQIEVVIVEMKKSIPAPRPRYICSCDHCRGYSHDL